MYRQRTYCLPLLSGTAFSIAERERLSIRGLVPPRCQEMDKQLLRIKRNLDALETPLSKFVFLSALQDRNETLFYKLLIKYLDELASIIYTPTGKIFLYVYFLPNFSRVLTPSSFISGRGMFNVPLHLSSFSWHVLLFSR